MSLKSHYSIFLILVVVFSLTGCTKQANINQDELNQPAQSSVFLGEKGEEVVMKNDQIVLGSQPLNDGIARFYNTELEGKTIHFFVVKDKNGIYRAAANACQVCFDSKMGFRQEGDFMVCNTCQNKYPLEKIATERGGCNPVPINPNLEVKGDEVVIKKADLEQVADFFD